MKQKRYKIPTWSPAGWTYTIFPSKVEFRDFIKGLFKEPGKYQFDKATEKFNEHSTFFLKKGVYTEAPEDSNDFITYWDTEKEKCRKGIIIHNGKGQTWYLTRWYYHWLNFLQIYNKAQKRFTFPDIRDHQYHVCLYEQLAILYDKDEAAVKKRQMAWSYLHQARVYNHYIFEDGFVIKIMASDKKYINATHGEWKFLQEYHNFNNTNTAWACGNLPDKVFEWKQLVPVKTEDGRSITIGTKATISGITLDKDPLSGVGGACDLAIYVEGGIAPEANITHEFMRPAMKEGGIKTGSFNIGGSVGDLDQCEPLKDMILNPDVHDIYPVYTNLLDENGTEGWSGLFIPEQWGYVGDTEETNCMDQWGNSLVEKALAILDAKYEEARKKKKAEDYQMEVSQGPRNIREAFAIRTVSIFPVKHTSRQMQKIEAGEYGLWYIDLERTEDNKIVYQTAKRTPNEYGISTKAEDKRGCVVIHEFPGKDPEWGTYYWSADPVETGKTSSSESLASIFIYKNPIEVTRIDGEGNSKTFIEGDKLVAEWTGRYDDVNETNEQMSRLIEFYNAWGISEIDKPSLVTYMTLKKRTKYLAPSDQMLFDKELGDTGKVFNKFGWRKGVGGALWKKILQYGVDWLSEELGEETNDNGYIVRVKYGVERIPFINLIREMQTYQEGKNADRVIAYCALIAFSKLQQAAHGIRKREERKEQSNGKTHNFDRGTFLRSIGNSNSKLPFRRVPSFRSIH